MTFNEYREIILNGDRVEWYSEMVPSELLTSRVYMIASIVIESLNKIESELDNMHGNSISKQTKRNYLESRWNYIKTLPYHSNGLINDSYMIKYKKIIDEDKKNKEKVKHKSPKLRIIEKDINDEKLKSDNTIDSGKKGKNSKLIFGK